jgi:hypothetical protein
MAKGDSYGIELISPPLDLGDHSFEEIRTLCDRIKGRECHLHGATTDDWCGLHVHVAPKEGEWDLLTLKHMAYVLVMYEDCIDKLLPNPRRSRLSQRSGNNVDLKSNRCRFEKALRSYYKDENKHPSDPYDKWIPLLTIRQSIFNDCKSKADLVYYMTRVGGRDSHSYLVNFHNLVNGRPETIEFRQHEGVLSAEMVKWWVTFCVKLVCFAEKAAYHTDSGRPNTDGSGYATRWDYDRSIWRLFEIIEMPAEGVEYFERRAAYLAADPRYLPPKWEASDPPPETPPKRRLNEADKWTWRMENEGTLAPNTL